MCRALKAIYGNARVQPGSGNQPGKPNDVFIPNEAFVECKETSKSQITLKYAWLGHLRNTSVLQGLRTYLAIRFSTHSNTDYFIVDDQTFYHLLRCEKELAEQVERAK